MRKGPYNLLSLNMSDKQTKILVIYVIKRIKNNLKYIDNIK